MLLVGAPAVAGCAPLAYKIRPVRRWVDWTPAISGWDGRILSGIATCLPRPRRLNHGSQMADLNSLLLLEYLLFANIVLVGAALFYWSKPISKRYNAWTARIRQSFSNISEPPSAESAQVNFKIIVFCCRICGAILIGEGAYYLVHAISRLRR